MISFWRSNLPDLADYIQGDAVEFFVHIPSKALSWFIAIPLIFLQRESELGSITMI